MYVNNENEQDYEYYVKLTDNIKRKRVLVEMFGKNCLEPIRTHNRLVFTDEFIKYLDLAEDGLRELNDKRDNPFLEGICKIEEDDGESKNDIDETENQLSISDCWDNDVYICYDCECQFRVPKNHVFTDGTICDKCKDAVPTKDVMINYICYKCECEFSVPQESSPIIFTNGTICDKCENHLPNGFIQSKQKNTTSSNSILKKLWSKPKTSVTKGLPMDCVRKILSYLPPIKDTKGLDKYGYPTFPIYPYIKHFTKAVKDAYDLMRDNLELQWNIEDASTWGPTNYDSLAHIENMTIDTFNGGDIIYNMKYWNLC